MSGTIIPLLYAVGLIACVFHLANGIWTTGITWGLWTSPWAQLRATWFCWVLGGGLALLSVLAWWGATTVDVRTALEVERKMAQEKLEFEELTEVNLRQKQWSQEELLELERQGHSPSGQPQIQRTDAQPSH